MKWRLSYYVMETFYLAVLVGITLLYTYILSSTVLIMIVHSFFLLSVTSRTYVSPPAIFYSFSYLLVGVLTYPGSRGPVMILPSKSCLPSLYGRWFFSIGDWETFFNPRHGENVGNNFCVVPNQFRVTIHVSNQIGLGHFCVTAGIHISVPFLDVC